MDMPTSAHVLYIPAILLIGGILGFVVGSRAARDRALYLARQDVERQAAREARAARRAQRAEKSEPSGGDDADAASEK